MWKKKTPIKAMNNVTLFPTAQNMEDVQKNSVLKLYGVFPFQMEKTDSASTNRAQS